MEVKDMFILQSEYHGCLFPGNTGNQGISGIDGYLVIPEYSNFNTRQVYISVVV